MGSWEAPVPSQLIDVKMWSAPCETLNCEEYKHSARVQSLLIAPGTG